MRTGVILLLTVAALIPVPAGAMDAAVAEGRQLVETYCAMCHATGFAGASPHPQAPPFRTLHLRYDVGDMEEALVEGLVTGHPDMPAFEFDAIQAAAIIAYLRTLQ